MPRYYFHTQIGADTIRDREGEVLPDAEAARRAARRVIRELTDGTKRDLRTASLRVVDGRGETVVEFPFAEALGSVVEPRWQ